MANFRCRALLDLARDQACANCGAEDGTVVAAHSNWSRHGKGAGIKAHDCFIAFLCYRCHMKLDQGSSPLDGKLDMFQRAMDATMLRLWQSGKIKVQP